MHESLPYATRTPTYKPKHTCVKGKMRIFQCARETFKMRP